MDQTPDSGKAVEKSLAEQRRSRLFALLATHRLPTNAPARR
jgi:hypothetical protein